MVTGDQILRGKPPPDIFLEAARRLSIAPHHCLVLEDSEPGLVAARAAGMMPILIPDAHPPSPAARLAASYVVASLHEARELIARHLALATVPNGSDKP